MKKVFDPILEDMESALALSDYEAVEVLWVAFIKIANLLPGDNEHKRIQNLVERISSSSVKGILNDKGVDALLNLDPPLEIILTDKHERLYAQKTNTALNNVSRFRIENPKEALINLGEILKRIRNKRVHGFKTRSGPRDQIILKSASSILKSLCEACVEEFNI